MVAYGVAIILGYHGQCCHRKQKMSLKGLPPSWRGDVICGTTLKRNGKDLNVLTFNHERTPMSSKASLEGAMAEQIIESDE